MQVDVEQLVQGSAHPMVRHAVSPATYDAAWVQGSAVVARGTRHTLALGPPDELVPLMGSLADEFLPDRLTVDAAAYAGVPRAWTYGVQGHWHWMWTTTPAPEPDARVVEVTDAARVEAVLDVAMPASHARPGMPGIETWLGVTDDRGDLVGVGAVRRDHGGSGHLCGVCVLPGHAGRGLGRVLSGALTRRAMDRPPHVATLGVYVDNAAALRVYDRLGYTVAHTLMSGPVTPPTVE